MGRDSGSVQRRKRGVFVRRSVGGWAVVVAAVLSAVAVAAAPAAATDFTWTGGADSPNWSASGNWVGGSAPATSTSIGTLSLPELTSDTCLQPVPTDTCSQSNNDVGVLAVNQLQIDPASSYQLSGFPIELGSGGLDATSAGPPGLATASISLPIVLSSSQTWTIGGSQAGNVDLTGGLSGQGSNLTVNLGNGQALGITGGDNELGDVSVAGPGGGLFVGSGENFTDLDATDGHTLTVTGATLYAYQASVGAYSSVGGGTQIGRPAVEPTGMLKAASATFDASSNVSFSIAGLGPIAGRDYGQLSATGPVDLGGAGLEMSSDTVDSAHACAMFAPHTQITLVTTTGALTGEFGNAPAGGVIPDGCDTAQEFQIAYSAQTVTATVIAPTTTTLSVYPQTAVTNQPVTLIAQVTAAGPTAGEGTVSFQNATGPIPGCTDQPLNQFGIAGCETTAVAATQTGATAVFTPAANSDMKPSQAGGAYGLLVKRDATTTSLAVPAGELVTGQTVTYFAGVSADQSGPTQPTGSIEFLDNNTPISGCAHQPFTADHPSSARCDVTYRAAGSHTITAIYRGDANFTGSSHSKTIDITAAQPIGPNAKVVAQTNLQPTDPRSKALGIATVIKRGTQYSLAIVAQGLRRNTLRNAYAVWLYNSRRHARLLGFVDPGVGRDGRLSTAGPLPTNAKHYREIILTLETTGSPKRPGPIILKGRLRFS
jgi:hypothetical protein